MNKWRPDNRLGYHGHGLHNSPEMAVPQSTESNKPVYMESNLPCVIAVEYESHMGR